MKALILAAGKGTRLQHLTEQRPKCLVDINGTCILDYQLQSLVEAGIRDIIVVAGYRAAQVQDHLGDRAKVIVNDKYAETNSIYSLWLACAELRCEEFVLMNGDIIIDGPLMRRLITAEGCAALVDNQKALADGEMNVVIDNERIVRFSKSVKASEAHGESVQITKFSRETAELLFDRVDQIISAGQVNHFPASAYEAVFERTTMVPVYIEGARTFEIDTVEDYEQCCRTMAAALKTASPRGVRRE